MAALPQSASREIPSTNEAGLARLTTLLEIKQGFQFFVLVCPDPQERDRLIARLGDAPALAGRSVLRIDLAEHGPLVTAPANLSTLEDLLEGEAPGNAIVHLVNGDGWLNPERITELNLHRNALAARVPASLLWWLPEATVTELARGAPDVWSWRTAVVAFEAASVVDDIVANATSTLIAPAKGWLEVIGLSREEKATRLTELEDAISHVQSLELRRELLMESADLLTALGRLDEALAMLCKKVLPLTEDNLRARALTQARIADILLIRGQLSEAMRIRTEEELPVYEKLGDVRSKAVTLGKIADILVVRGELDEALRIRVEEQLPVFKELGDMRSTAVTQGKIADILMTRDELDEAQRILTKEQLPIYEDLGDERERAVTLGKIADILVARRQLDDALRIRVEEELPVYEKLGDTRWKAVTQAKIADILAMRGQSDEAERILTDDVLPAFEEFGDLRGRAVTQGKIADIMMARGKLDEALHLRTKDELPIYEDLGDVRSVLTARANIGIIRFKRNAPGDRTEARHMLELALADARQLKLPRESAVIESWLKGLDEPT